MYSPLLCLVYSVISNYLAWLTVLTSKYVECKNHVAKGQGHSSQTSFIAFSESQSYPVHNFVLQGGISKLFGKTLFMGKGHVPGL